MADNTAARAAFYGVPVGDPTKNGISVDDAGAAARQAARNSGVNMSGGAIVNPWAGQVTPFPASGTVTKTSSLPPVQQGSGGPYGGINPTQQQPSSGKAPTTPGMGGGGYTTNASGDSLPPVQTGGIDPGPHSGIINLAAGGNTAGRAAFYGTSVGDPSQNGVSTDDGGAAARQAARNNGVNMAGGAIANPNPTYNPLLAETGGVDPAAGRPSNSGAAGSVAGSMEATARGIQTAASGVAGSPAPAASSQTVPTPSASTYNAALLGDPTKLNLTPEQTVAGQMASLTQGDAPWKQQAETNALQHMGDRGIINSSMARTAADQAVYQAAAPIAAADAAAQQAAGTLNTNSANDFAVRNNNTQNATNATNAAAKNTLAGQVLSSNTQIYGVNVQANSQAQSLLAQVGMNNSNITSAQEMQARDLLSRQGINTDNLNAQQVIARLQSKTATDTATINAGASTANTNTTASASTTNTSRSNYMSFVNNLTQTSNQSIYNINTNPNMTPEQKQAAINQIQRDVRTQQHGAYIAAQMPGDESDYIFGEPVEAAATTPSTAPAPATNNTTSNNGIINSYMNPGDSGGA